MTSLTLDPRLKAVADMVRPGCRAADIGTDHGLVAAYLIKSGRCLSVIASDIAQGPLEAARKNLEGVDAGKATLVLCDGLAKIAPDSVDDIIIAGMGGEMISRILNDAQRFWQPDKRFVLQPMTRAHVLREYLLSNGFNILDERPVLSAGRPYSVMLCAFAGVSRCVNPSFYYIGRIPAPPDKAGCHLLLKTRAALLQKRIGCSDKAHEIDQIIEDIDIAIQGGDPYGH